MSRRRSREHTMARLPRAARADRGRPEGGTHPASSRPRAWSSGSTWAPSISSSRSRAQVPWRAASNGSAVPGTSSARPRRDGSSRVPRRPARVRRRRERRCARARSRRRRSRRTRSTSSPSKSSPSAPTTRSRSTTCTTSSGARTPSPTSRARSSTTSSTCSPGATSDEFAELRPRIVWDRTAGVIRGRTGAGSP